MVSPKAARTIGAAPATTPASNIVKSSSVMSLHLSDQKIKYYTQLGIAHRA
jgi:hypothetical protein